MGPVRSYRDLEVWKKAIALAKVLYKETEHFPEREKFGLASQLRRAAVSVPSNIAEGQARRHTREFEHFLYHSLGSLAEIDTQLVIALDAGYLARERAVSLAGEVEEVQKMLRGLIKSLDSSLSTHN